jgi:hypothetical protein
MIVCYYYVSTPYQHNNIIISLGRGYINITFVLVSIILSFFCSQLSLLICSILLFNQVIHVLLLIPRTHLGSYLSGAVHNSLKLSIRFLVHNRATSDSKSPPVFRSPIQARLDEESFDRTCMYILSEIISIVKSLDIPNNISSKITFT